MTNAPSSSEALRLRPMLFADLGTIMNIERRAYPFPWTAGTFRDCLCAGYLARVLELTSQPVGYGLISVAANEAHVLNLSIDPHFQSRGYGRYLLRALLSLAQDHDAQRVFLEVRPSNQFARALYESEGFNEIGVRKRYYPATPPQREDALVMARELLD